MKVKDVVKMQTRISHENRNRSRLRKRNPSLWTRIKFRLAMKYKWMNWLLG